MSSINPPRQSTQPHQRGWFYDLLRHFKRADHPVSAELDDLDYTLDLPGADTQVMDLLKLDADRKKKLSLFDEMDAFGLVQSILDLYAEETTQPDYDKQRRVWIESKAKHMIDQGDIGLQNMQVEDRITSIARRVAKYGDEFRRHIYETGKGILGWRTVPAGSITRIDDRFSRLVGFKQDGKTFRANTRDVSWPWDYSHFRLPGKDSEEVYGTSMLEPMFRPWRQLALTEDAMLMFRLRRAPDRNAVFVNIGSMDPTEGAKWLNAYRKKFRKSEFVDPASPSYKKQYNPLTPLEDVFIPVRNGDEVRVESLSGSGTIGETYDLEYFRDAFFGSARVPKAYLGFEGDINAKATLVMQDIRFARGCKKLRSSLILGIRNALDIHFVLSNPADGSMKFDPMLAENNYIVQMSPISYLDEFERLELVKLRFDILEAQMRIAGELQLDLQVWAAYILLNYAKLPEDLVMRLLTKAAKPPDTPAEAQAFEKTLSPEQRALWASLPGQTQSHVLGGGDVRKGFGVITLDEEVRIAETVHRSPQLRKVIGDIHYLFSASSLDEAAQQIDSSLIPPRVPGGAFAKLISESDEETRIQQLREDLERLGTPETKRT